MKIAIVGSGIAGNVAAWHLNREHEITVFEAEDYVGGHSNTLEMQSETGPVFLDTGFMVFNDRTYPNFLHLMDELDVGARESEMSFSVQCKKTGLEYNGSNFNGLFAQRRNLFRPSFHKMIRDILRFNREALPFLGEQESDMSLGDYLDQGDYSKQFIDQYLIPMGAAIWSAEPEMMRQMPAQFFIRFFDNHGLLSLENRPKWKVVEGGSQAYVRKLVAGHESRIRLSCPVQSVIRNANEVLIKTAYSEAESFDCVFFACHSDQALAMIEAPTQTEHEILGAIPFQNNEVILHSDSSLMPRKRAAWASWNYHVPVEGDGRAALTYHLNRLHSLTCKRQFFVTLNSGLQIRPELVIKRYNYTHPVFTLAGVEAQGRQKELNGQNRSYFCGAYWRNGFHEDGVASALAALGHFKQANSSG